MLSMLDPHSSHWSRSSKGSPRPWVSTRQWCTAQPPPASHGFHFRGNEGNVYRMPTFKTAMTATWKYSNFLLKPFESNRIQIEDGKNWFTIWDFLFKHGFLMKFLSPFCLNKTSKIYQNLSKSMKFIKIPPQHLQTPTWRWPSPSAPTRPASRTLFLCRFGIGL